jgi:hypothetical protein
LQVQRILDGLCITGIIEYLIILLH